jgi:hypothetical protein
MSETEKPKQNLRTACNYLFKVGKRWWGVSWWLKIITFLVGLGAVFLPNTSVYIPIAIVVVSFVSEAFNVNSSNYRSQAESLSRKIDFRNSFGWKIKDIEIADVMMLLPGSFQNISTTEEDDIYFTSKEELGWRRAMQNLQESAWYTKNLAKKMKAYCFVLTVAIPSICIVSLLITLLYVNVTEQQTFIARITTASLLLVVSSGLIQFTKNYDNLYKKAEAAENQASKLLESTNDETLSSIKAFNEYHLAKASAPPIPDWLWDRNEKKLNANWKKFVAKNRDQLS